MKPISEQPSQSPHLSPHGSSYGSSHGSIELHDTIPNLNQTILLGDGDLKLIPERNLTHLPVLDGLRGIAILLVMIKHTWLTASSYYLPENLSTFDQGMMVLLSYGWAGVDLFFVLSGFLITRILLQTRRQPKYFSTFYYRRLVRIFPLYYVLLIIQFYLLPALATKFPKLPGGEPTSLNEQLHYFGYLANFYQVFHPEERFRFLLSPTWSLSVEEQFYLIWPFLVFLWNSRTLIICCLSFIVLCPWIRWVLIEMNKDSWMIYSLTPWRCDGLAMGALVAFWEIAKEEGGLTKPIRRRHILYWVGIVMCISAILGMIIYKGSSRDVDFTNATMHSALSGLFTCLLLLLLDSPSERYLRVFEWSPFRLLGKYSYSIYLFHLPIFTVLALGIKKLVLPKIVDFLPFPGIAFLLCVIVFLIGWGVMMLWGYLSWHLFEKHFLSLKKYFPNQMNSTLKSRNESKI